MFTKLSFLPPPPSIRMLAGIFRGGHEVLVQAKLALEDGVTLQLKVRCTNEEVAEMVTSTIA